MALKSHSTLTFHKCPYDREQSLRSFLFKTKKHFSFNNNNNNNNVDDEYDNEDGDGTNSEIFFYIVFFCFTLFSVGLKEEN